jgi:ABC-2 type transport system permease protein
MTAGLAAARKVGVIAGTGLRRLLRDRSSAFVILFFPLLLVLVLGSVLGERRPEAVVGVVADSDDAAAAEVVATLDGRDGIDVTRYDDTAAVQRAAARGGVEAGVVIPDGYGDRLLAGEKAEIGLVARPGALGAQLRPMVESAAGPHPAAAPALSVRTTTVGDDPFPASLGQFDLSASSQVLLFVFVTGLASASVLIQTRELGVARRMLSTPTSPGVVIAGEACGRLAVTLFQGLYIMVATWLFFGVDWGDPVGALAVVAAFALVAAGAAMLLGAVFRNDRQAQAVAVIVALGMAALGGSMTPLEVFSPTMRTVAHLTPHAWGNEAFAELVRHDGTVLDILPQLGVLLAMATVLLALATRQLRRALTTA